MKKEFKMPKRFYALSEQEMEKVAGGTMTNTVKGKRRKNTGWREFWYDIIYSKK